jgi:hypothetical protein
MSPRPRASRSLLAVALALTVSATAAAAPPAVLKLARWDASAVERAVSGAGRRLQNPRCQAVLDDFEVGGRTLRAALDEWGTSPAEYLRLVPFLDGSGHALCRRGNVALVTEVGVRRVFVCTEVFSAQQLRNPGVAESMVIHEILHTLGLGENPPSSIEITQRVESRCR